MTEIESDGDALRIQTAQATDAQAIAELQTASWQATYRGVFPDEFLDREALDMFHRHWEEMLSARPERGVILTARTEHDLIGFIAAIPAEQPDLAFIDNLHVQPGDLRRGLGTKLMAAAADALVKQDYTRVYLKVARDNVRARGFYAKLGGRESPEFLDDIAGFQVPAVRFDWPSLDPLINS